MRTKKSNPDTPQIKIAYEQFCETWLDELNTRIEDENSRNQELLKLMLETHLSHEFNENDFVYVGKGEEYGIDAIYFEMISDGNSTSIVTRILRYLPPKFGSKKENLVLREVNKATEALDSATDPELQPVFDIWRYPSADNRIIFNIVSLHPLSDEVKRNIEAVDTVLQSKAQITTQVEELSLYTFFIRENEDKSVRVPLKVRVPDIESHTQLVVGAVGLPDLFDFLKNFKTSRGDLDALYDKNVRLYLGKNAKNKEIAKTIRTEPENFGLYNNGLTIVTREIAPQKDGTFLLTDPSIVNGCQTTRTLWDLMTTEMRSPKEADAAKIEEWNTWYTRFEKGLIVVKVVRVAPGENEDAELLTKITRFTNLQSAVNEKDFISLDVDFKRWKRELLTRGIFLEILRGEANKQQKKQNESGYKDTIYTDVAKAFELFKVYGAGWMNEPGPAWNDNKAFIPKGRIFNAITNSSEPFGGDDFMAALYLQKEAEIEKFNSTKKDALPSRRQTKFLFYRTIIELLRRLLKHYGLPTSREACTKAILALQNNQKEWRSFIRHAVKTVDDYMGQGDFSINKEPSFSGDSNNFFKNANLAKSQDDFPQLWNLWNVRESAFYMEIGDTTMAREFEPIIRRAFETSK